MIVDDEAAGREKELVHDTRKDIITDQATKYGELKAVLTIDETEDIATNTAL